MSIHVLGLSADGHDAAAALVRDGMLVAAVQEDRFTRRKHDGRFPSHAARACLDEARIDAHDLDWVVFHDKPSIAAQRLAHTVLATFPRSRPLVRESARLLFGGARGAAARIAGQLGVSPSRVLFVDHHLAHAASAFCTSPFEEAAILTIDGVGGWTTAALGRATADWGHGGRNQVVLTDELRFPHSLGALFAMFTAFLGFDVHDGEDDVMGLAAFGEPRHVELVRKIVDVRDDGSLRVDPAYVALSRDGRPAFTRPFLALFGPPRDPSAPFRISRAPSPETRTRAIDDTTRRGDHYADVAASIQRVTEDVLVRMATHLQRRTGLTKLCVAGGVALNATANARILAATAFDEMFVPPAAGDAGAALGAALLVYHVLLGKPRRFTMDHAYWGRRSAERDISAALEHDGWRFRVASQDDAALDEIVDRLAEGRIVGWYHGRFEWGARGLGARSVLADPRRIDARAAVNVRIKRREPWRPLPCSVLAEKSEQCVAVPHGSKHHPARFMLHAARVTTDAAPAVTSADGSGLPQVVHHDVAPRFHRLIEKFDEATGVPMLLNTSFNLPGEPLVASPEDALRAFAATGMDLLVLENFIVDKTRD